MKRTIRTLIQAVTVLISSTISIGVSAVPIAGTMDLTGGLQLLKADGTTTLDITQAATIDFLGDVGWIMGTTGDFDDISTAQVNLQDIDINPFSGPIDNFWVTADNLFSFNLTGLVSITPPPVGTAFLLEGTGTVKRTGYDDTAGFWTLSSIAGSTRFSWNSTTGAIPEPTALMLLGIGLVGMGYMNKRRAA